jgi:hypothetical protein
MDRSYQLSYYWTPAISYPTVPFSVLMITLIASTKVGEVFQYVVQRMIFGFQVEPGKEYRQRDLIRSASF